MGPAGDGTNGPGQQTAGEGPGPSQPVGDKADPPRDGREGGRLGRGLSQDEEAAAETEEAGGGTALGGGGTSAGPLAVSIAAPAEEPEELDVTSPPYRPGPEGDSDAVEYSDGDGAVVRETGDPVIQQSLWVEFRMVLSVLPDSLADRDAFLRGLDGALEDHLEREYENLIDRGGEDATGGTSEPTLQLQQVDLNLQFVQRRRTARRASYLRPRDLQQTPEQLTIDAEGTVDYSMQVDGGGTTPDAVQEAWGAALGGMVTQARLEEAIGDAGIEGVVSVDQATLGEASGQAAPPPGFDANEDPNDASGTAPPGGDSGMERPSTLSIVFGFALVGIAALGLVAYAYIFYRKRRKSLRKKRQMAESITFSSARAAATAASSNNPGKLSKGGGSSSAANRAGSFPAPPLPESATTARPSALPPLVLSPTDDDYNSDASASYRGLEASLGSEDPSDSFAKELQLAASLDQQAWDEFQRKKRAMENHEVVRASELDRFVGTAAAAVPPSKSGGRDRSPASGASNGDSLVLVSGHNSSVDDDDDDDTGGGQEDDERDGGQGVEADPAGNTSWAAKSFPYGDEMPDDEDDGDHDRENWDDNPRSPPSRGQWEPYNSALPPSPSATLLEEKKDERSPTNFFAQQLQNIQLDMARYGGGAPGQGRASRNANVDDNRSTTEILSEVEEITRYVKRYERRRDRKTRREMDLHDRLSVGGSSAAGAMSIGMDGRVYNPHQSNDDPALGAEVELQASSSPVSPPSEMGQISRASSYAESYSSSQKNGSRKIHDVLSFVSNDEEDSELEEEGESLRGRRLGISPFSVSKPDERYLNSDQEGEDSTRTLTSSSRSGLGSVQEGTYQNGKASRSGGGNDRSIADYRYGVGYGYGEGSNPPGGPTNDFSRSMRSSSSRLANLRANNAIIDSSDSDVNPAFSAAELAAPELDLPSNPAPNDGKERGGVVRVDLRNHVNKNPLTDSKINTNTTTGTKTTSSRNRKSNNNRFDRLRGLFEQKTIAQPEPIYPPGEHWQYGVAKK